MFITSSWFPRHNPLDASLNHCQRAGVAREERRVDRGAHRGHTVAGTLHDGIDFGVAHEFVFCWPLKPIGAIFDTGRKPVVAGGTNASIIRHDDGAHTTGWIFAPRGDVIGQSEKAAVPSLIRVSHDGMVARDATHPWRALILTTMLVFTIAFTLYTVLVIVVGLWTSRQASSSDEEYFLAGRSLGPWVSGLSASASSESGWVTLGLVGWAFQSGIAAYWILPGALIGFVFNWFVLAGKLRTAGAQVGAVTIPDFLSRHFAERLQLIRLLSVVVILVAMMLYCAAQFAAAGKAFDITFESVTYQGGVLIGAAIVLIYVTLGGFRAACWTDLLQGLLMVGVLVLFPLWMLGSGPSLAELRLHLHAADPQLLSFWPSAGGGALIGFLLGSGALGINFGYVGQPHVLVRFLAMRSPKDAIPGGVISIVWVMLVLAGAVTSGILVRALAEGGTPWAASVLQSGDGEYALVAAAINMAPAVLGGLVLAAIFAAICSTADSQLVVASSAVANDIWSRLLSRGGTGHTLVNRLTVVLLGMAAVALVLDQQVTIYDYVLTYGWAILGASFGPQIILAVFWKRATAAGCVAGMATGFAVALLWKLLMDNQIEIGGEMIEVYNLPLAFVAALMMNLIVSLMNPRPASRMITA